MSVNLNVISQFDAKGLNRAQSELDKLAASTSSISTKLSGAAKVAGAGILVGAGAVAAGLFAIGSSFDEAFDNIRIGTGATGPALEALQADMKAVAGAVPASFGDAGKAVTVFSQKLGLTGAPLQTLSSQVLELSRMTGTDLGGNLTAVTDVFNNFGVGAGEQSGKLDLLFRASQASGVSVAELAGTMSGAGVVLREVGLSFDQSAGFLATLAKAGVDAGDVMPALSKSLATAAKQGKDASSVFTDTFNAIKGAPDDVAGAGVALDVFGAKAGPKLAALIREGKLSYEEMTAAIAGGGETILGASADTQDFAEKLTMLKNRVFLAIEPIATKVFNAIGEAMDKLGPKVDEVSDFFSRHMDVVKQVAFVIGTLAVIAIGAYTYAMIQAAIATVLALSPIYLIIAAVVAVVAVLLVVWNNWDTIWKWIMEHKAYAAIIAILAGPIVIPILAIVGIIKWLQANWETVWSVIQTVTSVAVDLTVTYFTALIEYVKFMWNIFQILSDVVQNVFSAIVSVISGAAGAIGTIFGYIVGAVQTAIDFFLNIPNLIGGIGSGIANAIGDGFKAAWNSIAGLINAAIPDNVGFGFGPEIDLPDNPVPTFAKGGIFNAAMNGGSGLAVLHDNEMILNPQQQKALFGGNGLGGGGPVNVTINMPPGSNGADVVNAIKRYEKTNGTSWRN
jgi:TP901 family phage tail tape measure protein